MFNSLFGNKPPQKGGPIMWEPKPRSNPSQQNSQKPAAAYSKVFRWRLPDGQTEAPATVDIVGSFTHWQKVPLTRDGVLDAWHASIHHIPSHQTHHYMLLVNGKPAQDKNCDGLAVPHGPQEEQFALLTDRGPRVFMLFAQTK